MSIPFSRPKSVGRAARIRRRLFALGLFVASFSAGYYWLLGDGGSFSSANYSFDINAVRRAAGSVNGLRATDIQVETISHKAAPKTTMIAGTSWQQIDLVRVAYRVVFPDQSIIIDTAYDAETAQKRGEGRYDDGAWLRLQEGMRSASHVVVTHEHADHIGGLLASPYWKEVLPRALITEEQFNNPQRALP